MQYGQLKVLAKGPESALDYNNLADNKAKQEDYSGAIVAYNKAIELDPTLTIAYIGRGDAKSDLNDNTGAIDDYSKVIEIDPDDAGAYYNRGAAKALLKDYKGALIDLSKAEKLGYSSTYIEITISIIQSAMKRAKLTSPPPQIDHLRLEFESIKG